MSYTYPLPCDEVEEPRGVKRPWEALAETGPNLPPLDTNYWISESPSTFDQTSALPPLTTEQCNTWTSASQGYEDVALSLSYQGQYSEIQYHSAPYFENHGNVNYAFQQYPAGSETEALPASNFDQVPFSHLPTIKQWTTSTLAGQEAQGVALGTSHQDHYLEIRGRPAPYIESYSTGNYPFAQYLGCAETKTLQASTLWSTPSSDSLLQAGSTSGQSSPFVPEFNSILSPCPIPNHVEFSSIDDLSSLTAPSIDGSQPVSNYSTPLQSLLETGSVGRTTLNELPGIKDVLGTSPGSWITEVHAENLQVASDSHSLDSQSCETQSKDSRIEKESVDGKGISLSRKTADEEVGYDACFGMIQIDGVELSKDITTDAVDGRTDVMLKIRSGLITIHRNLSGEYGGLLDRRIAQVLCKLTQEYSVCFKAFMLAQPSANITKTSKKDPKSVCLYIVIYGSHDDCQSIGTLVSENAIYLQHPRFQDTSVVYDNPHYLARPGCYVEIPDFRDPHDHSTLSATNRKLEEGTRRQVLDAFDTAQGPLCFSAVEASKRLLTNLKNHQLKALAMMAEKESGNIEHNEFNALWECHIRGDGQKRYRNVVTGAVNVTPPPMCLGGLLADEMGLGKTLTALALVSGSIDSAKDVTTANGTIASSSQQEPTNRTTLIVVPLSTLSVWEEQIKVHFRPSTIRFAVYHGASREEKISVLLSYDIVLTTYSTLTAEFFNRNTKRKAILFSCEWFRVILDEAHVIRDRSTKQHRSICNLRARHRWCLTGTPLQNQIDDFGALLSFLRVFPFDSKPCFNSHIAKPIIDGRKEGISKLRNLVHSICLRRSKTSVFGELKLRPRIDEVSRIELDEGEKRIYHFFRRSVMEILDDVALAQGRVKSVGNVLQSILRLRQICNHPDLLSTAAKRKLEDGLAGPADSQLTVTENMSCESCGNDITTIESDDDYKPTFVCMHVLCRSCSVGGQHQSLDVPACPLCTGIGLTPLDDNPEECPTSDAMELDEVQCDEYRPSSKITALLKNLHAEQARSSGDAAKSVIFTSWTKMLDLVGRALKLDGFTFERIDGSKCDASRRKALRTFRSDPACTILLASIGSAGVGLDLTVANHIHLLEPQWNPMSEEQALDRVHRMGQTRQVIATRYIVKDSIEEYVVALQKKKLELIQQCVQESSSASSSSGPANGLGQRLEDLRAALQ